MHPPVLGRSPSSAGSQVRIRVAAERRIGAAQATRTSPQAVVRASVALRELDQSLRVPVHPGTLK